MTGARLTVTVRGVELPCLAKLGKDTFIVPLENGWNAYVAGLRLRGQTVTTYGVSVLTTEQTTFVASRNWTGQPPSSQTALRLARTVVGEPALHDALIELSHAPSPPHGE